MLQQFIVCAYVVVTIGISFWSQKKSKSTRSYEGHNLGLLFCVMAGAGEWLGGTATTGVSEYGYIYGISGAWYTVANSLGICFLALFFAELYRRMQTPTVSGIVGKYIGTKAKIFSAAMLIFIMMAVGTSQMVAIGTLGEALFEMEHTTSILVLGSSILLYTVLGGMVAVGYTNILHMVVMYAGAFLALALCLRNIGGLEILQAALPESYFKPLFIGTSKVTSWIIASLLGACTAQAGLQPILTARDENTAQKASFWIAVIVAPFGILMALLGMIAKIQFPELENAKLALPTLLLALPAWSGGFVIASICAAILSTASPIFLSVGTLFTRDIYQAIQENKNVSDRKLLLISRGATFIGGSICILLAVFLGGASTILDLVYFAYSLRGSLFIILLLGIFWKKLDPKAAMLAMVCTMLVGLIWVMYKNVHGFYPIHPAFSETYISILVAFSVSVLFSFVFGQKKKSA